MIKQSIEYRYLVSLIITPPPKPQPNLNQFQISQPKLSRRIKIKLNTIAYRLVSLILIPYIHSIFIQTLEPVLEVCLDPVQVCLAFLHLFWGGWWFHTSYYSQGEAGQADLHIFIFVNGLSPSMHIMEMTPKASYSTPDIASMAIGLFLISWVVCPISLRLSF